MKHRARLAHPVKVVLFYGSLMAGFKFKSTRDVYNRTQKEAFQIELSGELAERLGHPTRWMLGMN